MADLIDQIRPLLRRVRDRLHDALPTRETGHGFRFVGSQRRFREAIEEPGMIEAIKRLAPALKGFVNVGANAGFFCLLAESLGLEVIGFEPQPAAFRLLQRNLNLNGSLSVPIPVAITANRTRASFYGTGTAGSLLKELSGTPRWDRCTVITTPLDGFFAAGGIAASPTDSLWLLDCEGSEPEALQGARRLLDSTHALLLLELVSNRTTVAWNACVEELRRLSYSCLLACSSLVKGPARWRLLTVDVLNDLDFQDNTLVISGSYHAELMSLLSPLISGCFLSS